VVTWIVVGLLVLAVLVLVAAGLAVAGRVRPLVDATRRLRLRAEQAERLQGRVQALQETVAALQEQAAQTAGRPHP
jgi:hypothetical protein